MGSLIDTGIFIAIERGKLTIDVASRGFTHEPFLISAVTAAELLEGVERADSAHRPAREAIVEGILNRFPLAPLDLQAARIYAKLMTSRAKARQSLATHDLMIATTAIAFNCRVITRDAKSFSTISGLEVVLR